MTAYIIALYNHTAYHRTVTIKKKILAVHFLGEQ